MASEHKVSGSDNIFSTEGSLMFPKRTQTGEHLSGVRETMSLRKNASVVDMIRQRARWLVSVPGGCVQVSLLGGFGSYLAASVIFEWEAKTRFGA